MMIVAHNEIVMLGRKLFESLGFAVGDYEDAADMIAWCELLGWPVLATIADELDHFRRPYERLLEAPRRVWEQFEFDGRGQSCLLVGPLVADYGDYVAQRDGAATVRLQNCRRQRPLLGYLQRVARRGRFILATWRPAAGAAPTTALFSPGAAYPTLYRVPRDRDTWRPTTDWLLLQYGRAAPETTLGDRLVGPAELAARFAHHRDNGIAVDAAVWARLTAIGRGVLVAASDESRRRGAGE